MSLVDTVSGLAQVTVDLDALGFVTVAGTQVLTNKTISGFTATGLGVLTGVTLSGNWTQSGVVSGGTFASPTISGGMSVLDPVTVAPGNGDTVTLSAGQTTVCVNPAGTIAAATVIFPPAPVVGQPLGLGFTQIITTLTLSGGVGVPVVGAVIAAAVGGGVLYRYKSGAAGWVRVAF